MARSKSRSAVLWHHARFWLAWWIASMALWLLLTTTVHGSEPIAGFGAAAVAATAAEVIRARAAMPFRPRLRWLRAAVRIPWYIATDTWLVFSVLVRHALGIRRVKGGLLAVEFHHGPDGDPRHVARRALATAAVSATPNSIVIGIDPDQNVMLVHQLASEPDSVTRLLGRT